MYERENVINGICFLTLSSKITITYVVRKHVIFFILCKKKYYKHWKQSVVNLVHNIIFIIISLLYTGNTLQYNTGDETLAWEWALVLMP